MLRTARILITACALAGLAAVPACDKKDGDDKKADAKQADAKKADAKPADAKPADAPADGEAKAGAPADGEKKADEAKADAPVDGDALVIKVSHEEPKPTDPVTVTLTGLKVVKAEFDPANIEGGSAVIEIDPNTLVTDSEKRDAHLKSPDYLNVPEFPTITVTVSDVKKVGEGYTAKLVVNALGKDVTWDATPFTVLETTDAGVRVKVEQKFKRDDFGIGKAEGDGVAQDLEAALTLLITKTD